ncbi:hypothetical protein Tco_0608649, partial [Tanacetum coccineum]
MNSEILIKRLISAGGISAGGISDYNGYMTHLKTQGIGGSPGTSFRVPDAEIVCYICTDNDKNKELMYSGEPSQSGSPARSTHKESRSSASRRLKLLFGWDRKKGEFDDRDSLISYHSRKGNLENGPVSIRERHLKSSLSNNKCVYGPSTLAKKNFSAGLAQGVLKVDSTSWSSGSGDDYDEEEVRPSNVGTKNFMRTRDPRQLSDEENSLRIGDMIRRHCLDSILLSDVKDSRLVLEILSKGDSFFIIDLLIDRSCSSSFKGILKDSGEVLEQSFGRCSLHQTVYFLRSRSDKVLLIQSSPEALLYTTSCSDSLRVCRLESEEKEVLVSRKLISACAPCMLKGQGAHERMIAGYSLAIDGNKERGPNPNRLQSGIISFGLCWLGKYRLGGMWITLMFLLMRNDTLGWYLLGFRQISKRCSKASSIVYGGRFGCSVTRFFSR